MIQDYLIFAWIFRTSWPKMGVLMDKIRERVVRYWLLTNSLPFGGSYVYVVYFFWATVYNLQLLPPLNCCRLLRFVFCLRWFDRTKILSSMSSSRYLRICRAATAAATVPSRSNSITTVHARSVNVAVDSDHGICTMDRPCRQSNVTK